MLQDLIMTLVDRGIGVTIKKNDQGYVYYDLNTEAKSHLYLFERNGQVVAEMRYDREVVIDPQTPYMDTVSLVRDCMCGRNYISAEWKKLLEFEMLLRGNE